MPDRSNKGEGKKGEGNRKYTYLKDKIDTHIQRTLYLYKKTYYLPKSYANEKLIH